MAADGHLGYTKMANFATGVPLPIDVMFASRMGFPAELRLYYRVFIHTLARNPCVSWAFFFHAPLLFRLKFVGVPFGVDPPCWSLQREEKL